MKVTGNTVLVTGGATGIGLAIAKAFLSRGNTVVICGRRLDRLEEAAKQNPGLHTLQWDVSDPAALGGKLEQLLRDFPSLNVLVNNAGGGGEWDIVNDPSGAERAESELAVNLEAPIRLIHRLIPTLCAQPTAAIVNVTSALAHVPMPTMPVYCATKAALHSFTTSLRFQLAKTPIKVFDVLPGLTETEATRGMPMKMDPPEAVSDALMAAMARDEFEVHVGMAKALYTMSRLAPRFIQGMLAKNARFNHPPRETAATRN